MISTNQWWVIGLIIYLNLAIPVIYYWYLGAGGKKQKLKQWPFIWRAIAGLCTVIWVVAMTILIEYDVLILNEVLVGAMCIVSMITGLMYIADLIMAIVGVIVYLCFTTLYIS